MYHKFSLGLAVALGLSTLVATAIAQVGLDRKPADLAPLQTHPIGTPLSGDFATGGFSFSGQGPHGASAEELSLSIEADQVVRQFGQAKTADDKDKLKVKLTQVLDKQFDQRQRRHESEIEALEAQVKKLKELIRLRNEMRREIVAKRSEQLLRDAEGLGW
jgi:hypothetical protein